MIAVVYMREETDGVSVAPFLVVTRAVACLRPALVEWLAHLVRLLRAVLEEKAASCESVHDTLRPNQDNPSPFPLQHTVSRRRVCGRLGMREGQLPRADDETGEPVRRDAHRDTREAEPVPHERACHAGGDAYDDRHEGPDRRPALREKGLALLEAGFRYVPHVDDGNSGACGESPVCPFEAFMGERHVDRLTGDEVCEVARLLEDRPGMCSDELRSLPAIELEEPCGIVLAVGEESVEQLVVPERTIFLGDLVAPRVVVPSDPFAAGDEVHGGHGCNRTVAAKEACDTERVEREGVMG